MTLRALRVLRLGFGLWVLGFGISHAQPADSPRILRTRAWVTAALQHVPGQADGPVMEARSWSRADLDDLRDHVHSVVKLMRQPGASFFVREADRTRGYAVPRPISYSRLEVEGLRAIAHEASTRGDGSQLLRRGAMLHTDIAMSGASQLAPPSLNANPALHERMVKLSDGRTVGLGDAVGHWELARYFAEATAPARDRKGDPVPDPFLRGWYRAVGTFMLREGKLWLPHFSRAVQLFDEDAGLLFLAGSLHETLAAPRIQDALDGSEFAKIGLDRLGRLQRFETGVRAQTVELREAESLYRRALALDASLVEARVRLGRVLTLLDRPDEAVRQLQLAVKNRRDAIVDYYAALLLGRAAEAVRDIPLARQSYHAAAAMFPQAQSPRLALDQLAFVTGDAATRRQAFDVLAVPAEELRVDPWWAYHPAAGRDADAVVAQLHAMLRAGDRREEAK